MFVIVYFIFIFVEKNFNNVKFIICFLYKILVLEDWKLMNLLIIYGYMMVYFYMGKYVCNFDIMIILVYVE